VLGRFISWFSPELCIVTENLTADEIAIFLMKLNLPDTQKERLKKQLDKLTRKTDQPLRHVMAYLLEIGKMMYNGKSEAERKYEIRTMMLTGLIRFTVNPLREEIDKAIRYAKETDYDLDWKVVQEKAIEKEILYGTPQIELKFRAEAREAVFDYNVNTKLKDRPDSLSKYRPDS
jgi:hypothetical protein